ncbi:MAG TPA: MMPL family transporter [Gaiellaceae bacterium]|jgi:RND superfamily putative drug exporter|nr:MMPL family transporter [Gaiellaceae bacterium]
MEHGNIAARAGRWSAEHWETVTLAWLAFCVIALFAGGALGTKKIKDADTASGGTAVAEHILANANFKRSATESVLVASSSSTVKDPAFRAAVNDVITAIKAQPNVRALRSPLDPKNTGQLARGGRAALVEFDIKGDIAKAADKAQPFLDATAAVQKQHPDFTIGEFGFGSANHVLAKTLGDDFKRAEVSSLPVTLIILLFAFGALVAAGLPVLLAFSGVLATIGLASVASHLFPAGDATQSVILLIGMAVGVDYSLFYIRREREERASGLSHREALLRTAGTSGYAVFISGLTVFIAMAGMLFTGNAIFTSIAVGAMLMVAVALIGSLSILPALLSKLGDRVNKGRIPLIPRRTPGESRVWNAVLSAVLKRPVVSAIVSAAALFALALPTLQLHTQLPSFTDLPKSISIVRTYDAIQAAFPGAQTPADVVIKAADVTTPQAQAAIGALERDALASGQVKQPVHVEVNPAKTVAIVSLPLIGDGSNQTSVDALLQLRGELIPATVGKIPGSVVAVTGQTAGTHDFNQQMKSHAPLVFGFVLLLCFVLLLVTFRSIVIPIKAVLLNLLSVGAAYGLLVLVFQHTWAEGILSFHSNGAIASWLPLFLFVVLFGLSMDYHVFILSRVKELVDAGMSTDEAVATGIKRTASTVTSAALVMVGVFAIFITLHAIDVKQMGFGLAAAILIDATIVRAVLLPSVMKLLGDWNWYLPRWLDWLPDFTHERSAKAPEAPPVPVD